MRYTLTILLSTLLWGCQSQVRTYDDIALPEQPSGIHKATVATPTHPFVGTWRYSFPFFSNEISFLENHTFSQTKRGCTGSFLVTGTWTAEGNLIYCTPIIDRQENYSFKEEISPSKGSPFGFLLQNNILILNDTTHTRFTWVKPSIYPE